LPDGLGKFDNVRTGRQSAISGAGHNDGAYGAIILDRVKQLHQPIDEDVA